MIHDIHYSSLLDARMQPLVQSQDYKALTSLLGSLPHSQFRTACYMMGERYALQVESKAYWQMTRELVCFNNKAFLVTMLKALPMRFEKGLNSVADEGFANLCEVLNDIDMHKAISLILPLLKNEKEVALVFERMSIHDAKQKIMLLLQVPTLPCSYVLFSSLRYVEEEQAFMTKVVIYLVKRADSLAFNLASLIRTYFGLENINGTFSLNLKPYQLSRLETSYQAFAQVMQFQL